MLKTESWVNPWVLINSFGTAVSDHFGCECQSQLAELSSSKDRQA